MARPTTRKGTANPSFRRRLPADVKRILDGLPAAYRPKGWGKDEIVITLGTADRRKAASEHARISADVEQRLGALRAGVRRLTHKEAVSLSGLVYRGFAEGGEDNPGKASVWTNAVLMNEAAMEGSFGIGALLIGEDARRAASMEERFGPMADALLSNQALVVDQESRVLLIDELARATDQAALKLARNAEGDYRPDGAAERFPAWNVADQTKQPGKNKITLTALFDRWASHPEQEPQARRTKARYRGVFNAVSTFLDNPDARTVSTADVLRYVEARMADPGPGRLQPKVARDVHKAAISSVYGWALGKGIVKRNPAEGVPIKVTKARQLRPKGASDIETAQLVNAALAIPLTAGAGTLDAAKRWATMLALYTGCRIGEATQLRRKDIASHGGFPMIHVTPEAGDVKDREGRLIPVHPRLVELGFLAFVETAPDGPLFYGSRQRRNPKATTPEYELVASELATWGRENGLGDPLLKKPLHALRHRFMTLARRADIEEQYVVAISGHSTGRTNRDYGHFEPETLHREIQRLTADVVEGRKSAGPVPGLP